MRAAADARESEFLEACRVAGFTDEWDAYRAEMRGQAWPEPLDAAHRTWMRDLHAFYLLRDGPNGFLGGRETRAAA